MNFRRLIMPAISLLVILPFANSAAGQFSQNRSSITGFVFDTSRRPVSQVPVELMNEVNSVISRTRTDTSGRYFFQALSQGRFAIRVLPLGTDLIEQTQDVEISGVGVRGRPITDHVQLDFYLRARRDENAARLVTGTIYAQEVPADAESAFQKALDELKDKNFDAGVAELENAVRIFPTYFSALERLGLAYLEQKKFKEASEILTRAVQVNPRAFNAWYGIAYADYSQNLISGATEAIVKAVELDGSSSSAVLLHGILQRQAKQYNEAEASMKKADKLSNGRSADVHWNLALLYAHNMQRYADAANRLEQYLESAPDLANREQVKKVIKHYRDKARTGS